MLKINLLPPYINQRKQVRVATGIVTLLVAAEIAALVMAQAGPRKVHEDLLKEQADTQTKVDALKKLGDASSQVLAKEAALAPKYDFIKGMMEYNKAYPKLYEATAGYTYKEVMFLDMEAS